MEEKKFQEEKQKLKQIISKIKQEEDQLEEKMKHESGMYDLENIAKGQVAWMNMQRLNNLKKIKDVPYFARMDFREDNGNQENFYIGKLSVLDNTTYKPVVIDWRTPMANLYYNGRLGEASYECLGEIFKGEILLKRQYFIEKQELKKYVDIDVTGKDSLLQEALEEKADDRLKNIVATIQEEQNQIIRAPIEKPLIVQGVAGSGKTTIALHRIAYLIYQYGKEFKPEEFMIIAPTKFFLNYISGILPDLGVEDVKQCTFEEFAYDVIGKKLKIADNNEKLVIIVNKEYDDVNNGNVDVMISESKFKVSLEYKAMIDLYLKQLENEFIPQEDFKYKKIVIMKNEEIKKLFLETYANRPFVSRISEVKKHLLSNLNKSSDKILEIIQRVRTRKIAQMLQEDISNEEKRVKRIEIYEKYEAMIKEIEKDGKKLVNKYFEQIKHLDSVGYYIDFIKNYLQEENETIKYLKKNTLRNLSKNEVAFEDLAALMYLQTKIFGIKEKYNLKHIVIDEAQDYGEFQFSVLKSILKSNSMTILGDIAQGIHFYRGIENWNTFMKKQFEQGEVTYTTLSKTYRTTKEIMDKANEVISKLPDYEKESIIIGEPVVNRKDSLFIEHKQTEIEIINDICKRIEEYQNAGYKSMAIIGKDIQECEQIKKNIEEIRKDVKLIKGKDSEYNAGISIVPSYLAKGLEFDCVFVYDANEEKYKNNSLDIKLLYVILTRAMSKLHIYYTNTKTELI